MTQRIKVMVRPKATPKDQLKNMASIDHHSNVITLTKTQTKQSNLTSRENILRSFAFTKIFPEHSTQEQIYEQSGFSLVQNVLEGYNGTIFAYGQTGSGKTYTIMGGKQYLERKTVNKKRGSINNQPLISNQQSSFADELKGIIPRAFSQIITVTRSRKEKKHLIQCSFLQIYNQNVHDLLGEDIKSNLSLKENASKGLVIEGLKTYLVKSIDQLQKYLKVGYRNRSVRQTSMNKQSSRSHCIFTIRVEQETVDQNGIAKFKVGKLNLVDLAGSERQSKTKIKDQGLSQAAKINLSLSALGKVINCLSNYKEGQKIYIPYRDSKLTRLLQDSLGGNTKTVMIATISQQSINYEQTLSTLIYASRAKFIQNKPVLNEDPKDVLLREYEQEIQKLKLLLMEKEIQNQDLKKTTVNFNKTFRKSLDHIEEDLVKEVQMSKEDILEEEKAEIMKKIQDLQNIVNKQKLPANQDEQKELQKIQQLKVKIKLQEQRQVELQKQKKMREQQLMSIQRDYNNLNEEVDIIRSKFTELKSKYQNKCEELQDFKKQYEEDRNDFHQILKSKDQQIKKLQALLDTVLQEQNNRQSYDMSNGSVDDNHSYHSTKKIFPHMKPEIKAKINNNQINLFRSEQKNKFKYNNEMGNLKDRSKQKITKQSSVETRNYESQQQKKIKRQQRSSFTSMKNVSDSVERQKRQKMLRMNKIKKVDSMISLKRDKSLKLPFVTESKKLDSSRKRQQQSNSIYELPGKISFDIARIKNEIIKQLKFNKDRQN